MSRTRNARDPFFATGLSKMKDGPRQVMVGLNATFRRSGLNLLWPGSGWRTGSVEHGSGTAADWMITESVNKTPTAHEQAQGMAAVNWLINNRTALGVEGILFSTDGKTRTQAIGYSQPFNKGWRNLKDRGSISANHVDHFHVKFRTSASWPSYFATVTIPFSGAGAPAAPSKPKPPATGDKPGYPPPFPKGIGPNKSNPSAKTLQSQLKKAGFMARNVKLSDNYGPKTQDAVAAFHRYHPAYASSGVKRDVAIGPQGWTYLFQKY